MQNVFLEVSKQGAKQVEADDKEESPPDVVEIYRGHGLVCECRDVLRLEPIEELGGHVAHKFGADDREDRAQAEKT